MMSHLVGAGADVDEGRGSLWPPALGVSCLVVKDRGRPRWGCIVCPGLLTPGVGGHKDRGQPIGQGM